MSSDTSPAILFVDDEPAVLSSIDRVLRNEPYERICVTTVDEALSVLSNRKIQVVVTDLMMPGMNGLEFLETIKTSYPGVVRICLSGQTQVPTILSTIARGGVFRYLTKPWRIDEEAKALLREAVEYAEFLATRRPS